MPSARVFAALILSVFLRPALAADCATGYDPTYERDWNVTPDGWAKTCAEGYDKAEALHVLQRKSVEQCAERFVKPAAAKKIGETYVRSLCAQGAAGRAKLQQQVTPLELPTPTPAQAAPSEFPRRDAGLGQVGDALVLARKWQPDACLARMHYHWIPRLTDASPPDPSEKWTEWYHYWFYSQKAPKKEFEVSWVVSSHDAASLKEHQAVKPESGPRCLTGVDQDLSGARERAADAGLRFQVPGASASDIDMDLDALGGSGSEADRLEVVPRLTAAQRKRLVKRVFWSVCVTPHDGSSDEGVILDAHDGSVLTKITRMTWSEP